MARESLIADGASPPLALLRPWLEAMREDLRRFLASISAPFIDDPSNDDDQFERVRMRRFMPQLALEAGIETAALARSARRLAEAAKCRRMEMHAAFNHAGGVFHHWGGASLSADARAASTLSPALCARLVHAVSGGDYAPGEDQAKSAMDAVLKTTRASLGGAMIDIIDDRIWFYREPAALTGRAGVAPLEPMRLAAGERAIWDRRFIVAVEEDCDIVPAGLLEQNVAAMPAASLFDGPSAALASLPTIRRGDLRKPLIPAITPQSGVTCRSLAAERFAGEVNRF
jgi:tRNA(Ile)-lysidine synthase